MPNCSVLGCTNKSGHLFPKNNPSLKRKWMKFAGLREKDVKIHSLICKIHFAEDAFEQHEPVPGLPPPRKRLKTNAVPTLFPNLLDAPEGGTAAVTPKKPAAKRPVVYNVPARSAPSKKILLDEVGVSTPLSDRQFAKIIERIRVLLVKNAHPSAVFPKHWEDADASAHTPKIRDGRPAISMPCLVAVAILASPKRMATPSQIIWFISRNFPGYELTDPKWHEKVFEVLEAYRLFQRVPINLSCNPRRFYYEFVQDRRTVMTPDVCEAFTDPSYDYTKIDPVQAGVSSFHDDTSVAASEDIDESRVESKDVVVGFIRQDDTTNEVPEVPTENSDSDGPTTNCIAEDPSDSDGSSDEDSVTFVKCSYCEFVASSTKTLSNHEMQRHWTGRNYRCATCKYETSDKEDLMTHKATHEK